VVTVIIYLLSLQSATIYHSVTRHFHKSVKLRYPWILTAHRKTQDLQEVS